MVGTVDEGAGISTERVSVAPGIGDGIRQPPLVDLPGRRRAQRRLGDSSEGVVQVIGRRARGCEASDDGASPRRDLHVLQRPEERHAQQRGAATAGIVKLDRRGVDRQLDADHGKPVALDDEQSEAVREAQRLHRKGRRQHLQRQPRTRDPPRILVRARALLLGPLVPQGHDAERGTGWRRRRDGRRSCGDRSHARGKRSGRSDHGAIGPLRTRCPKEPDENEGPRQPPHGVTVFRLRTTPRSG